MKTEQVATDNNNDEDNDKVQGTDGNKRNNVITIIREFNDKIICILRYLDDDYMCEWCSTFNGNVYVCVCVFYFL